MPVRTKYLVFNVAAWFALLVVGSVVLVLVRHYGEQISTEQRAYLLLDDAYEEFQAGDNAEAQRVILQAIELTPGGARGAMDLFESDILGLPLVHDKLREVFETDDAEVEADSLLRARYAVANVHPERADVLLDMMVDPEEGVLRMRANLALARGDIRSASQFFDQVSIPVASSDDESPGVEAGMALLWEGRWKEAFRLATRAREMGATDPELELFSAIESEVGGDTAQAIEHYTKVLSVRPDNLLALRSLARLLASAG